MRRRRLLLWTTTGLGLAVVGGAAVVLLLLHEPSFYRRAQAPRGPGRTEQCNDCVTRFVALAEYFKEEHRPRQKEPWSVRFSAGHINSFLAEELERGLAQELARYGICEPRLTIEADRLRVGFRYGTGWFSTIVSLEFRIWLAARDVNVVVLEILSRRAGALPISAQFFFDDLTELARHRDLEVTWYRSKAGNPVAVLRFQSQRLHPTSQLRGLDLQPGSITIRGAPLELSALIEEQ